MSLIYNKTFRKSYNKEKINLVLYITGKYKKSDLIVPVDLKLAFRRCHNAIYRSGIDSEDIAYVLASFGY